MATQLREDVWQLSLRGVNGYVIDRSETILVDGGTPWDGTRIRAGLAEIGIGVGEIDHVLLTHFDFDHVGALAALAPDLDAPVAVRSPDDGFLTGSKRPPIGNHKGLLQRVLDVFTDTPAVTVNTVTDGDTVGSFTAYATPGHTPGHTAYVSEADGVGVLGDLVRESGGQLEPSGWVISYETDAVRESICSLAERAPPFDVAAVGHGTPLAENGSEALAATARRLQA